MSSKKHTHALAELVAALDATNWSSWQTTAGFDPALERARALLREQRIRDAAPRLLEALEGVLPYMEAAESAGLVGHEGCHWPVEEVRAAIAAARGEA